MATKTVVKIKWNHFGIYRRFQIPLTDDCDIYKELLNKIRAVVPDFAGRLGWKGSYLSAVLNDFQLLSVS